MNPLPLLFGAIIAGFIGMAIGNLKNNRTCLAPPPVAIGPAVEDWRS